LDVPLAFALAAVILFGLANAFPLLTLYLHGSVQEVTLPGCIQFLVSLDWPWLAAVMITTVELAPLVYLAGVIHVLLRVKQRRATSWTARIFRLVQEFQTWGMVEVFLLGILVSYVKLAKMAVVAPGPSLYALATFILASASVLSTLEPGAVWDAMEKNP
jgi:paraquat-inducible protein A